MPRVPIVVYFYTGNKRRLARYLGEQLGLRGSRSRSGARGALDLLFRRRPRIRSLGVDARAWDHVLFVSPIWDRRVATPLLGAMDELAPALRTYSFASLCGYDRPGQREALRHELTRRMVRPPEHVTKLVVGHLFPPEQRRRVRLVSGHRVTAAELTRFAPELAEIIDGLCENLGARRSPVEAHE